MNVKPPLKITLEVKTGLHIGGSEQGVQIGGLDNPVIRDPISEMPYIPGSSIKGKMRSLIEMATGKIDPKGGPCSCGLPDCKVCRIFGRNISQAAQGGGDDRPTRLIVRDANLTGADRDRYKSRREQGLRNTEIKTETAINRLEGHVLRGSLRTQERVPPGWKFEFEFFYRNIGQSEAEMVEDLKFIRECLQLLSYDSLGKSGSRGYGQIELSFDETWFPA